MIIMKAIRSASISYSDVCVGGRSNNFDQPHHLEHSITLSVSVQTYSSGSVGTRKEVDIVDVCCCCCWSRTCTIPTNRKIYVPPTTRERERERGALYIHISTSTRSREIDAASVQSGPLLSLLLSTSSSSLMQCAGGRTDGRTDGRAGKLTISPSIFHRAEQFYLYLLFIFISKQKSMSPAFSLLSLPQSLNLSCDTYIHSFARSSLMYDCTCDCGSRDVTAKQSHPTTSLIYNLHSTME